jgi:hypothetical protein
MRNLKFILIFYLFTHSISLWSQTIPFDLIDFHVKNDSASWERFHIKGNIEFDYPDRIMIKIQDTIYYEYEILSERYVVDDFENYMLFKVRDVKIQKELLFSCGVYGCLSVAEFENFAIYFTNDSLYGKRWREIYEVKEEDQKEEKEEYDVIY